MFEFIKIVYENSFYTVGTFMNEGDDDGEEYLCYGVYNKHTGIMEEAGTALPSLLMYATQGASILENFLSADPELEGLEVEEDKPH